MNILILVLAIPAIFAGMVSFSAGYWFGYQNGWQASRHHGRRFEKLKMREADPYEHSRN